MLLVDAEFYSIICREHEFVLLHPASCSPWSFNNHSHWRASQCTATATAIDTTTATV